jgi:hypothetical protein
MPKPRKPSDPAADFHRLLEKRQQLVAKNARLERDLANLKRLEAGVPPVAIH